MRNGTERVLALLACLAMAAEAGDDGKRRVRLGGVVVSAGYSHFSGGYPWWGYPWGYYYPYYYGRAWAYPFWLDPWSLSPFVHPGFYTGFGWGLDKGEVKLRTRLKDAEVYVDGAFAGSASRLKSMWLDPGAYSLEVRAPGREPFEKRIYVLTGKTLQIEPVLPARGEKQP